MTRKARKDKGKKRKSYKRTSTKKQKVVKKAVENKQEDVKMSKQEKESQEFPILVGLSKELEKLLEALKANVPAEKETEDEEEVEDKKSKKPVDDEDEESDDEDEDDDDDEDEDDEDEDEKKPKDDEDEESDSDEDEIELDLDKLDAMDKEGLVEIAEKIGIKKADKMKEKELRAEIIKKASDENEEDEDDEDEDEEETPTFKAGDKVMAEWPKDKKFYKATISQVLKGGKYEVIWKDGGKKEIVNAIRERKHK